MIVQNSDDITKANESSREDEVVWWSNIRKSSRMTRTDSLSWRTWNESNILFISNLPCTWQKEGECVWERRKQWEKEIPNYAQETESEGFSNILQHHTTKNVAHQRFKLNLEAVHSFGGSVITAVLTYLSKNKLSNIY